jgi:hypothetical protein
MKPHPAAADLALPFDPMQALALFRDVAQRLPAAADAVELLERDLLPRSAPGAPYLVCGIVGPNNAGKSALFNALVGRDLSPSDPTGGATRRLVGAANAALVDRLQQNPHASGFRLREPVAGMAALAEALEEPADPRELVIVREATLPPHLVLIDTPDFDSILTGNRAVSESLLAVADVVIVVVTRHSYQNRAVVDFFQEWLRHGRPWLLVYNEAIDADVARKHAEKLVADVGSMPLGAWWAPHRLAVQRREEPLAVEPLPLPATLPGVAGQADPALASRTLSDVLHDAALAKEVKRLASAAAWARLQALARQTVAALQAERDQLAAVDARAATVAGETGVAIASHAMPAGPFAEAFRVVLDRRTNFLSRGWRVMVRGVRVGLERLPALLRGGSAGGESVEVKLGEVEQRTLAEMWPGFWETLVRDLGSEARADARRRCPDDIAAALDADLGRAPQPVRDAVAQLMRGRSADLGGFQQACEMLIDEAIEARGFDLDIQAAADIATVAPLAFAAAVIFTTTGVGADIAAAGGGAVGTFLFEKYSHVLGSGITKEARRRWSEMRGREIGAILQATALPATLALLEKRRRDASEVLAGLTRLAEAQP